MITKQKTFNKSMIDKQTQVIYLDEAYTKLEGVSESMFLFFMLKTSLCLRLPSSIPSKLIGRPQRLLGSCFANSSCCRRGPLPECSSTVSVTVQVAVN